MDTFTLQDLQAVAAVRAQWCVSLYMPLHPLRDGEQDRIRLRNLLREAEERLRARGLRGPEARAILAPAVALLPDSLFWSRGGHGLALLAAPEAFFLWRLMADVPELLVIAGRFHCKPLLPLVTGDGDYYILALAQGQVRLLEATRTHVNEIDVPNLIPDLPQGILEENQDLPSSYRYQVRGPSPSGERTGWQGTNAAELAEDRLRSWLTRIDTALRAWLGDSAAPLVLAGVDYLQNLYRQVSGWPHLVEQGIVGSPEQMRPEELREAAWPLVAERFDRARAAAAQRYAALAGTGRTASDLQEVLAAALHGRVEALFVALGAQVWGALDEASGAVALHDEPEPADGDLLDLAALLTLRNSGTVFSVAPEEVPGGGAVAALLRY
ncbi:MAG: hypothetical protein ACOX2L_00245 [Anaerolineae bacterium]|jgi:hypothetical protein|nr:hypothetical protein [Chloroflexota bacterium]